MAKFTLTKICTKCKIEKSIDDFGKMPKHKDGLCSWCNACQRLYYKNNREFLLKQKKQYYENNKKEILEQRKRYYETHKDKVAKRTKRYREVNKIRINEYLRQYYADNKEISKAKAKQYYKDNEEEKKAYAKQYRENNKEYISEWMKRYSQTQNGKAADKKKAHKRRAQKMGVGCEDFNPNEIFERDKYRCQLCGKKTRPDYNKLHPLFPNLDHIMPLSKGGPHTKKNTQCLCRRCNLVKYNTGEGNQFRLFG